MLRILVLLFSLLPLCVNAEYFTYSYDKNGQSHLTKGDKGSQCMRKLQKEFVYWDGESCREIEIVKKCLAQGGEWRQVQLREVTLSVADSPLSFARGFRDTCICPEPLLWDGEKCVETLPIDKQNKMITVWCDSLRKEMNIYIPDEILNP